MLSYYDKSGWVGLLVMSKSLTSVFVFFCGIFIFYASTATEISRYIRKCCFINESLIPGGSCVPSELPFNLNYDWLDEEESIDILYGDSESCIHGKYRLEPDDGDDFQVLPNGFLRNQGDDISPLNYCLESFLMEDGTVQVLPLVCFPPPPPTSVWKAISAILFPAGCLISVPFLVMVVVIYLGIKELRNTYGKVLASHSACLAAAYTSLAVVQIYGQELRTDICISMAYIIQFSFVSCFFWLNLLCYHTWSRMTKPILLRNQKRRFKANCTFTLYSIYAWGFPTIIFLATLIMDFSPTIPSSYLKPNFGLDACWFHGEKAVLPYFYVPIAVLLVTNIIFFILTARFLHKKKSITHMSDLVLEVIRDRRQKVFVQCLILFAAMGLNWIFEVLSWGIGGPPQLWLVTDMINTLQGPIIFGIFVLKDSRVYRLSVEKFCKCSKQSLEPGAQPLTTITTETYPPAA